MNPAYIFDIDGTIADGSHRLHHIQKAQKDWDGWYVGVSEDKPIAHIIDLACALSDAGKIIVYVSGRSDQCRSDTEAWLVKHGLPIGPLFMRKAGDHRNDDVLKVEILAAVRAAGYEPIMAFDDRDRVVAAWRAAGVPCAQVAPGDF